MIDTGFNYHHGQDQIRINPYHAQNIGFWQIWKLFQWRIKSHLQALIGKDSKPKNWPNSLHDTYTTQSIWVQDLKAPQSEKPNLKKAWKSVESKSLLEADSKQKLNVVLLLDIHWVYWNQKPSHSSPKTHCKLLWTPPCTWKRNLSFLHLFDKPWTYSWSLHDF